MATSCPQLHHDTILCLRVLCKITFALCIWYHAMNNPTESKTGRFSEIIRHSFWHLDTWFPVDAAGWVSVIGVALLEEGCFWGLALRFQKPYARFSLWTSYLGFNTWALSWQESEELSPLDSYFEVILPTLSCLGHGISLTATENYW